jgi:predicted CXXCH cytochrome family protein
MRVWLLVLLAGTAQADSILNSKHDFSTTGPGPIKAVTESDVCLFCHTPHMAVDQVPLWNHALSTAGYTPYSSTTTKASVRQPTGSSKLCLSCHDGTVAIGMVNSRSSAIEMENKITTMPPGKANLQTDLSDDHPVSFRYDAALASAAGQLREPSRSTRDIRLDHNGEMQCTSCHDPHNDQFGKFLVMKNTASALCLACHDPPSWATSPHATSAKTWNGLGQNPWPNATGKTVAANGCENCHSPHGAGERQRLLTFAGGDQACYVCHDGNVATQNMKAEANKASSHSSLSILTQHDAAEDPVNAPRHAACVDCHNPHAGSNASAIAPNANGAIAGVLGVNSAGAVVATVTRQYELCFRCHADSDNRGRALVSRQYVQTNARLQFFTGNASYHPLEAPGKNPSVPSLISPLTVSSQLYCTDCHNNSDPSGPHGPHGSAYAPILERRQELSDFQAESSAIYALCYKCHDRDNILNNQSFPYHRLHIVDQKTACATCHDSHGLAENPRLINFNLLYCSPSSQGLLQYKSTGPLHGNCSVTCHGKDHTQTSY